MTTPKRIQRKRVKGWRMPEGTVYVGRPGKWGNPYRVGIDGDAALCVKLYRLWMNWWSSRYPHYFDELRGKDLACWCKEGEPCHADVLLELANA